MKTYFLYTIQAYEHYDEGTGGLRDVVIIRLVNKSPFEEEEMLKKARKIIKKIGYRVSDISEYFNQQEVTEHAAYSG